MSNFSSVAPTAGGSFHGNNKKDPHNWKLVKVRDCAKGKCPVEISYQTMGSSENPAVLMVMGHNGQGIVWGDGLCKQIADAGYFVIRFDNRDSGYSTKFDHLKCAPMWHLLFPDCIMKWKAPYTLVDMAEDACGLLTQLGIKKAHWFGQSMGGMIVQTAAIHFPDRVASMVSMMSTTGNHKMPDPSLRTKLWFLKKPKSEAREDVVAHKANFVRSILCTGIEITPEVKRFVEDDVKNQVDRSTYELGAVRQMFAIRCAPARDAALSRLPMPTLVLHGKDDILVFPQHGEHTDAQIANGRSAEDLKRHKGLKMFENMGHYIGPWSYDKVCAELFPFWREADGQ